MDHRYVTDQQQLLADMARQGSQNRRENSLVVACGAWAGLWAIKVTSHVAYNIYKVRPVVLTDPGWEPLEIGQEIEATNLAESFVTEGTLSAGAYGMMIRIGEANVFYAKP